MNKFYIALLTSFFSLTLQALPLDQSEGLNLGSLNEKTYVSLDHIQVTNNGIFLLINASEAIKLDSLHTDADGFYIKMSETKALSVVCIGCGEWRIPDKSCWNKNCPLYRG